MPTVWLGLGANLGERAANLEAATVALGAVMRVTARSGLWETAPLYVTDQPNFLNMAVGGETDLAPLDFLRALKRLEGELGRVESFRYGPRAIDLDILIYDGVIMDTEELTLPHPRLAERRFALAPLAEIAPRVNHPVLGRDMASLLAELPEDDEVRRLDSP